MKNLILKLQIRFEVVINFNSYHTGAYLSFFLCVVFFRIMSGLIMFTVKLAVLITNVTIICGKIVPFQFNQFESMEDCTCVNHEFIFSGSGQKSFRMYNLHTLISSLKILPVLSQKYVMSPFHDFRESQNPALALLHYY